jgi:hypothetical protein
MGVRGPQPSPNARRNGAKVYISPAHMKKLDGLRGDESRADWLEQIIDECWEKSCGKPNSAELCPKWAPC